MIIVEGMDNTGKSTLITKLANELKLVIVNNRRRPQTPQEMFHWIDAGYKLSLQVPCIFDRWSPISEPIYGPICRGHHVLDKPGYLAHVEESYRFLNPLIIYCRPEKATILNWKDRDQMEGVISNAPALIEAYDASLQKVAKLASVILYDYEHSDYEMLKQSVRSHFINQQGMEV